MRWPAATRVDSWNVEPSDQRTRHVKLTHNSSEAGVESAGAVPSSAQCDLAERDDNRATLIFFFIKYIS